MSEDEKERKIGVTTAEGVVIFRDAKVPIFIYPSGSGSEYLDVYMQINFVKFCMSQDRYVNDYLEFLDEQEAEIMKEEKKLARKEKKKGFTIIKDS